MKTIVGVFQNRDQAEKAVRELRDKGFENQISIIARGQETNDANANNQKDDKGGNQGNRENWDVSGLKMGGDSIVDGATEGGMVGGLAGLAIGAGALAIPGLGALVAAGPIAALISGAATGGVIGGLVDIGVPEERSRHFEGHLRQGGIIAAIQTNDDKIDTVKNILQNHGATEVEVHKYNSDK